MQTRAGRPPSSPHPRTTSPHPPTPPAAAPIARPPSPPLPPAAWEGGGSSSLPVLIQMDSLQGGELRMQQEEGGGLGCVGEEAGGGGLLAMLAQPQEVQQLQGGWPLPLP